MSAVLKKAVKLNHSLTPDNIVYHTVYPKKYAHGFCFAVLCCGYTLADFPISIRLTSLALRQSNDCPSASKATLMNMDKYFMWIHYERLHNHNKANHNKTVCIFLGINCNYNITSMISTHPSISILWLGCCPCPIWWGWQYQATSNTGSYLAVLHHYFLLVGVLLQYMTLFWSRELAKW